MSAATLTPAQPSSSAAADDRIGLSPRRNFSWALVGNLVYTVCQWAMVVVLAKLGTPTMVGVFSLALAITAPVILFANLNLRTVQATDARNDYLFGDYIALRLVALAVAVVTIAGIVLVSRYDLLTALVVAMVTLAKLFDSLSDVIYGRLQQYERMDRIAISRIIQGALQLVVLAAAVFLTGSLLWGTACMAIASGLVTAGFDAPTVVRIERRSLPGLVDGVDRVGPVRGWRELAPRWSWPTLHDLARLTLPLGMVAALASLNANIPRYFIQRHLGAHDLGIFAAISYLVWAGGMVTGSLFQSASPRLARHYVCDMAAYKRLLWKLIAIGAVNGVLGVVVALTCGRPLLTLLYSAEYAGRPVLFAWLMTAAGLSYAASAIGVGIAATRRFGVQLPVHAAIVVVTALGSAWLVPRFGLEGAAWAFLGGMVVWLVGFAALLARLIHGRQTEAVAVP